MVFVEMAGIGHVQQDIVSVFTHWKQNLAIFAVYCHEHWDGGEANANFGE
jgi:hypothetical protein